MNRTTSIIAAAAACISIPAFAGEPTYFQGKNIFIEMDVDAVD